MTIYRGNNMSTVVKFHLNSKVGEQPKINFIMILLNASSMNTYANSTREEECWSPYDEYIQEILAIKKEKRAFGLKLFNQIILKASMCRSDKKREQNQNVLQKL